MLLKPSTRLRGITRIYRRRRILLIRTVLNTNGVDVSPETSCRRHTHTHTHPHGPSPNVIIRVCVGGGRVQLFASTAIIMKLLKRRDIIRERQLSNISRRQKTVTERANPQFMVLGPLYIIPTCPRAKLAIACVPNNIAQYAKLPSRFGTLTKQYEF